MLGVWSSANSISYRDAIPPGNKLSAGRWFSRPSAANVAKDQSRTVWAKTLGHRRSVTGLNSPSAEGIRMQILNLRKLNWDSMRVNFFV